MKIRGTFFIAGLCALVARAADSGMEFSGVLTNDGHTKIALTNKATGTTTWVEPGQDFQGYSLKRYDAEQEAIYLRKNGEDIRLSLAAPKAPNGVVASAPVATPVAPALTTEAAANAIRGNLRMLSAAARRLQQERGLAVVTYADLVGADKTIPQLRSIAGESYANLTFSPTTTSVSVAMADGAPVSVDVPAATVATATAPLPATATAPAPVTIINVTPPAAPPSGTENLEPTGRMSPPASYTTGNDDTWESIAQKTGITPQRLKELNSPIATGSSLPQGQTIRLR